MLKTLHAEGLEFDQKIYMLLFYHSYVFGMPIYYFTFVMKSSSKSTSGFPMVSWRFSTNVPIKIVDVIILFSIIRPFIIKISAMIVIVGQSSILIY